MSKRSRRPGDGISEAPTDVEAVLDLVKMRSQTPDERLTLLLRALARQALLNACDGVASPVQKAVGEMITSAGSELVELSCLKSVLTVLPSDLAAKSLYSRVPDDTLIHIFTFLPVENLFAMKRLASWAPNVMHAAIAQLTHVGTMKSSPRVSDLANRGLPNCVVLGKEIHHGQNGFQIIDRCSNLTDIAVGDDFIDHLGDRVFAKIRSVRMYLAAGLPLDSLHASIQASFPSLKKFDLLLNPLNLDLRFGNGLLPQLRVLRLNNIAAEELAELLDNFPPQLEILKIALLSGQPLEVEMVDLAYPMASKFQSASRLVLGSTPRSGDMRIFDDTLLPVLPESNDVGLKEVHISGLDSMCQKFLSSAVMFAWPNLKHLQIRGVSKTDNNAEQFIAVAMPNIEMLGLFKESAEMVEAMLIGQDAESRFKHLKYLQLSLSDNSQVVPDLSPACRDLQVFKTNRLAVIRSLTTPGSSLNFREMMLMNVDQACVERISHCSWPKLLCLVITIKEPGFSKSIATALARLATTMPVLRYVRIDGDGSYTFAFLSAYKSLTMLTDVHGLSKMDGAAALRFLKNDSFNLPMLSEVQHKLRRICG
eukprot:436840_1